MADKARTGGNRALGNGLGGAIAARQTLARLLVDARRKAKVSQSEAADALGRRTGKLHKLENGLPGAGLSKLEVRALVELYGITDPETIQTLEALSAAIKVKGPFQPYRDVIYPKLNMYLGLEGNATEILSYDNDLLPGLLQTKAYAQVLVSLPGPDGRPRDEDQVAKRVELRLERQGILTRETNPLVLDAILDEAVLRRLFGDARTRIEQLQHLGAVSKLPNVSIRVVPYSPKPHPGRITGQFLILRFPGDNPPFVYSDGYLGDNYWKEPEEVTPYEEAFEKISKYALSPAKSRAFIEQIAKEIPEDD